MRRSCHCRHPARVLAPFVDTLDDALFVIDTSVAGHPFGLVVVLLDDERRVLTVVEFDDVDDDTAVPTCDVLLGAAGGGSPWRAAVLATDRAGRGVDLAAGDHDRWWELSERFAAAGVELVDWLLLDGPLVRSLDETLGGRDAWL